MKKFTDVLILNRSWCPVQICDWKKAISLIYQDAAKPLDMDFVSYTFKDWTDFSASTTAKDYPKVHSSSLQIAIPEVITLTKYDRLPIRDVKYSRQTLFERDGYRCAYCGGIFQKHELTVDHIIPRSKGGMTTFLNTISSCKSCNFTKADRTPEQAGMHLLFRPKKPKWISPLHKVGKHAQLKSWQRFMEREPDVSV